MTEIIECPYCGSDDIGEHWVKDRKLQYVCRECRRDIGKPRIPEKVPIKITKDVMVSNFNGWEYEAFDQYGYTITLSETYETYKECYDAALKDIKQHSQIERYGNCRAVIWPPTIKVKGKLVTIKSKSK